MKITYALIGIVVVGAGAWFVMNMLPAEPAAPAKSVSMDSMTEGDPGDMEQFRGSMQELMARSGSWRCEVTTSMNGISSHGTTYVTRGMVRADFTSDVPQIGTVESHMIMRDNTAYTWSNMMNRGFKFPIEGGTVQPEVSAEMAAQVHQEYDYACNAWVADESVFALPSGITF